MKYMTFNSSCPYAGLANMLSFYGIDTTDREIALGMNLPYMFACEDGAYLAGASLQSAEWFNLYLNPLGFSLVEARLPKSEVPQHLLQQKCAMLGIFVENAGKHAVIYSGSSDDGLHFINNKWAHDPSPEVLTLAPSELMERIDDPCMVATLQMITPAPAPIRERMEDSLAVLESYRRALMELCTQPHPTAELRQMLNPMFRALLLDGIAMLELIGSNDLREKLVTLQRSFLTALRTDSTQLCLADHFSPNALSEAIHSYAALIRQAIK